MDKHIEEHRVEVEEERERRGADEWPKGAPKPEPKDVVMVGMTEEMARRFEERCLGQHTKGYTYLAGPLFFQEDDTPTYIIGSRDKSDTP